MVSPCGRGAGAPRPCTIALPRAGASPNPASVAEADLHGVGRWLRERGGAFVLPRHRADTADALVGPHAGDDLVDARLALAGPREGIALDALRRFERFHELAAAPHRLARTIAGDAQVHRGLRALVDHVFAAVEHDVAGAGRNGTGGCREGEGGTQGAGQLSDVHASVLAGKGRGSPSPRCPPIMATIRGRGNARRPGGRIWTRRGGVGVAPTPHSAGSDGYASRFRLGWRDGRVRPSPPVEAAMARIAAAVFADQSTANQAMAALTHLGLEHDDVDTFVINPPGRHGTLPFGGDEDADDDARPGDRGAL